MHQHALNAVLQRDSTRVTSPTRTPELQEHLALVGIEPAELNISTILLNRRANPCIKQLLDHRHHLGIPLRRRGIGGHRRLPLRNNRLPTIQRLGDERKHLGLNMRPIDFLTLRNSDKVWAIENAPNPVHSKELSCQRGAVRVTPVQILHTLSALREHRDSRDELQRLGVRRRLRLDEHAAREERDLELWASRGEWAVGFGGDEGLRVGSSCESAPGEHSEEHARGGSYGWYRCEHCDVVVVVVGGLA